tara:strand:+ start:343 stop:519 length:177 start_codon:yes stop_codon:yes gene_type:complete
MVMVIDTGGRFYQPFDKVKPTIFQDVQIVDAPSLALVSLHVAQDAFTGSTCHAEHHSL